METNISSAYENWAIFSRRKLVIVLELLHLKMEVTVSEPCDVIRVIIYIQLKKINNRSFEAWKASLRFKWITKFINNVIRIHQVALLTYDVCCCHCSYWCSLLSPGGPAHRPVMRVDQGHVDFVDVLAPGARGPRSQRGASGAWNTHKITITEGGFWAWNTHKITIT